MRTFKSAVAGESFSNADGASRQEIIRRYAKAGAPAYLIPEPTNRHDANAVKVCLNHDGSLQVGFIPSHSSARISREILDGYRYDADVFGVHGGGNKHYGLSIEITAYTKRESRDLGPRPTGPLITVNEPLPHGRTTSCLLPRVLAWLHKWLRS